jgi:hypothetical protein
MGGVCMVQALRDRCDWLEGLEVSFAALEVP